MTYTNVEKSEIGYAHAVKEGKKMKRSDRFLSLSEPFKATNERFKSIRPLVRR